MCGASGFDSFCLFACLLALVLTFCSIVCVEPHIWVVYAVHRIGNEARISFCYGFFFLLRHISTQCNFVLFTFFYHLFAHFLTDTHFQQFFCSSPRCDAAAAGCVIAIAITLQMKPLCSFQIYLFSFCSYYYYLCGFSVKIYLSKCKRFHLYW